MQEESKETGIVETRKRKWPMIVGISIGGVICILAILVSLIPTIVSSNMVKNKIINNLESSLSREVQIDDINMSWSSGLDIKNIHIKDGNGLQGVTFVRVNRILCDIDFLSLIRKQFRINDLLIDSPEIVLQKGKEGVLSGKDISKPIKPTPTPTPEIVEKPKYTLLVIPAFLFDNKIKAKISNGKFTFIDRQLQEKTIIRDLNTTLNVDSLIKPIEFHSSFDLETKGEIEHSDISLNVSLAKDGEINPKSARGTLNMRTGFAQIAADFDMAKFIGEGGAGLDFSMNVDLEKLTNKLGGILGMPEGMQIEGVISSKIKADGQLEKVIDIDGNTEITNLNIVGGLLPENIEVAGNVQSSIKLKGRQSRLEVKGTTDLKNLFAKMGTVGPIKEPEIQVLHDVIYNLQNSNLEINNLSVKTSFAEIKSTGTFNKDREFDLNLLLSSDVEKLTQNLQSIIALPQGLNVSGKIAADILASGSAENELKLSGTTILHGINATGGPLKNNRISNLDLKLLHTLDYKIKEDFVYIKQMDISSDFLEMKSKGGIADLSKEKNIDYVLSLNMDLDKTTTQFAGMFPSEINITGNGIVDLGINGKLSAKENENLYEQMDIHGSISMDKIKYDAYELKDFKTKLLLDDGFFTTKDFAFILNEGPGTVTASANLKEEKPSLVLGMTLSDMLINQNMDLLAYIVPVLAAPDGKISGKLSMTFDANGNGLNWQDDLSKSLNGQGEFDIKDGHIKGGKITSKILKTFGKGGEYEFDNISTRFVIKESKIFNDDISINGKDFNIGLSGWTSFDGRLEYSADAKVMGDLIGGDFKRILGGMSKGSKLPIVVTGTVSKPKLAFKWPNPQEIGNILQGILGGSKDSKQQTKSTGEPTQAETAEPEKEAQPKEKIRKTVEKLFKDFFK